MPQRKKKNAKFGAGVRRVRVEQGYPQEAFAAHAGLDRSYYGAIERGEFNVSLSTLEKLAAGLGMKPSELLARAGL
ncbi:MAG TPA: helix-turn-helix transcriptional regulator [Solirubrobacteraceae bacterium]|nr:helix-turn-helix transcriptional regulator [Solirubrobacteraceae bacterium]